MMNNSRSKATVDLEMVINRADGTREVIKLTPQQVSDEIAQAIQAAIDAQQGNLTTGEQANG